jgi:hypothetical protein
MIEPMVQTFADDVEDIGTLVAQEEESPDMEHCPFHLKISTTHVMTD